MLNKLKKNYAKRNRVNMLLRAGKLILQNFDKCISSFNNNLFWWILEFKHRSVTICNIS